MSLSQARWIQSTPSHPMHLRSILMLSFRLRLSNKNPYVLSFLLHHATIPSFHILFDLVTLLLFGNKYELWSSSLCSFHQSPVTPLPVRIKVLPQCLVNILSLCSALDVSQKPAVDKIEFLCTVGPVNSDLATSPERGTWEELKRQKACVLCNVPCTLVLRSAH